MNGRNCGCKNCNNRLPKQTKCSVYRGPSFQPYTYSSFDYAERTTFINCNKATSLTQKRQLTCDKNLPTITDKLEPPKKLTPVSSPARSSNAVEELQPSKQARPASESPKLEPADLQKLKKAHYPYHSIHLAKHDCSRPVTRRNPLDMPDDLESLTRLTQVEEWEEPEKLEEDDDQNKESLITIDAGLKQDKQQQSGCICGAAYAGGDETSGSVYTGVRDIGYLEIWEFHNGQESMQGYGKHEGRKSISKVYTVLPVTLISPGDLPSDSPLDSQKQESNTKKLLHCNKATCKTKEEAGVETSKVVESEENSGIEKSTSDSETETSKQNDDRDDDIPQHLNNDEGEAVDSEQADNVNDTKCETPSRLKAKSYHRDSIIVTKLRKSREANKVISNKSVTYNLQRNSSFLAEKSSSSSEGKSDSTKKKQCSLRSVIEHEYLQFSLRITEDIIRNDLYNNEEMKRVFNSHIEANRGRLDMNKMKVHIKDLCKELNVAYDDDIGRPSCREEISKVQENLKNIICFTSPQKEVCLPCNSQLANQVREDDVKHSEKSSSTESELKIPSETSSEKELKYTRNKTKASSLPIIAEAAPPTEENQLRSASPHRNKTPPPSNASPSRKKPATPPPITPTKAKATPKTTQSLTPGENDKALDETSDGNLPEAADGTRKSSEEPKRNELNIVEIIDSVAIEQVPKTICSVCCTGKVVCPPGMEKHYANTRNSMSGPGAPPSMDLKTGNEDLKPKLIFVAPVSNEKKDFAMMEKQQPQPKQGPSSYKVKQIPSKKCKADKTIQKDALTGIPALDNTLRNYNLEMLAQSPCCSSRYEYHTQTEPPCNLLHETYKSKRDDLMPYQKTADEYIVVSGPIYIPTHVIQPHSSCNCAPPSSVLKPVPRADETGKPPKKKKDTKQINLLLTDDYNSRNRPDISVFYPTVSTQTSSSDFFPHQSKLSSACLLLETPEPAVVLSDNFDRLKPRKDENHSLGEESEISALIDTYEDGRKLEKDLRIKTMLETDVGEKDVFEKEEEDLEAVEAADDEVNDMFDVEPKSSIDHLRHKVNEIIDMRVKDDGNEASSESIIDGHIALKSSGSDAWAEAHQTVNENEKNYDEFMKKLDHKPDMSMTNSMVNSIKKVNRESQQFRNPDDKRITWSKRKLKIQKLTDSENEIDVIQEEEEEEESERQSYKSVNNKME